MTALADAALVCRQVVILRSHGWSQQAAVAAAADAHSEGPHAQTLSEARRLLESGTLPTPSASVLLRAVAGDQQDLRQLEWTASAFEARASAAEALRLVRFVLTASTSGTLVLAATVCWLLPGTDSLLELIRWAGLPLAAGLAGAVHVGSARFAPGVSQLEDAARMRGQDRRSEDPKTVALGGRARLAQELHLEGLRRAAAFRDLAPMLGATAILGVLAAGLGGALWMWVSWLETL